VHHLNVMLREDVTRFTIGNGAKVLANINNLVLALVRQAGFQNVAQVRRFCRSSFPDFAAATPTWRWGL
jgi:hypothetical protein